MTESNLATHFASSLYKTSLRRINLKQALKVLCVYMYIRFFLFFFYVFIFFNHVYNAILSVRMNIPWNAKADKKKMEAR